MQTTLKRMNATYTAHDFADAIVNAIRIAKDVYSVPEHRCPGITSTALGECALLDAQVVEQSPQLLTLRWYPIHAGRIQTSDLRTSPIDRDVALEILACLYTKISSCFPE